MKGPFGFVPTRVPVVVKRDITTLLISVQVAFTCPC
jgi:hypothetical protein